MTTTPIGSATTERTTVRERAVDALRQAAHFSHEARLLKTLATDAVEDGLHAAERTIKRARQTALDARDDVTYRVKREPLKALARAFGAGAMFGLIVGPGAKANKGAGRQGDDVMTDRELQQHVLDALDWDPGVDAAAIGVSADNGVVTLRGDVSTYAEKQEAERVALRVYGVKAVANDIVVRLASGHERTDTEIAQAAVAALKWNSVVPPNRVTVTVADGWVTLNGTLHSYHQSAAAERTVRDLKGVKGVSNAILLERPVRSVSTTDVAAKIEAALKRSAEVDARRISVSAQDGKVVLTGNVRSWAEREDAERAAWAAPGVMEVDDRISVVPQR